jgi:hypothetical protein
MSYNIWVAISHLYKYLNRRGKRKEREKRKIENRKKGEACVCALGTINLEQLKLVCEKCIMLLGTLMLALYLEDTHCFLKCV